MTNESDDFSGWHHEVNAADGRHSTKVLRQSGTGKCDASICCYGSFRCGNRNYGFGRLPTGRRARSPNEDRAEDVWSFQEFGAWPFKAHGSFLEKDSTLG